MIYCMNFLKFTLFYYYANVFINNRYDDLNVEEHLKLIAMVNSTYKNKLILINHDFALQIKGFPKNDLKDEIIRISTFVGLHNDLKTRSKSLSGGMKRRLSVAMAMIGDSKILILGNKLIYVLNMMILFYFSIK